VRVVKHQNRLPSKVAESPSFKIFKSQLDMVLCNLLQAAMLWVGRLGRMISRGPVRPQLFRDYVKNINEF